MCGAFYIMQSPALRERYGIVMPQDLYDFSADTFIDPRRQLDGYGAATRVFRPTDKVFIIAQTKDGELVAKPARW